MLKSLRFAIRDVNYLMTGVIKRIARGFWNTTKGKDVWLHLVKVAEAFRIARCLALTLQSFAVELVGDMA